MGWQYLNIVSPISTWHSSPSKVFILGYNKQSLGDKCLGAVMFCEKMYCLYGQLRPRSACTFVQFDQGLCYLLVESVGTAEYMDRYSADKIKMPRPLPIFSQSDFLIQVFDTKSHT